jgi:Zn-dependent protease with chaperone function
VTILRRRNITDNSGPSSKEVRPHQSGHYNPFVFPIRALVALLLILGFYSIALGLIAVLVYLPYATWVHLGYFSGAQTGFCVVSVLTIGYAVWPRREYFLAPGPRLAADAHPRLSALLDEIAREANLTRPEELYLIPEVNAWVSRRGGRTFSGGRMVMGLGLPLLAVLTPSHLRAVLGHEFGHEQGGDTALGGWIYGTRLAMIRAGQEIRSTGWSGILMYPLLWYSKMFLRVTAAIARRQELSADAQAARIAGSVVAGEALVTIERAAIAFDRFLRTEVFPILERGYRPPLAAGFACYFRNQEKSGADESSVARTPDPYPSHPDLKERLSALGCDPALRAWRSPEATALSLIENPESFEPDLLGRLTNQTVSRRAKPITWEELQGPSGIELVYGAGWNALLKECGPGLGEVFVRDLAGIAKDPEALGRKLVRRKMMSKDYVAVANQAVGIALVRLLQKAGWSLRKEPGLPIRAQSESTSVEPFEILGRLREDAFAAEWQKLCGRLGIDSLPLANAPMP